MYWKNLVLIKSFIRL